MGFLCYYGIKKDNKYYYDIKLIDDYMKLKADNITKNGQWISLILGENGAGKSYLFRQIICTLRYLYGLKAHSFSELKYDSYELQFLNPGNLVPGSIKFETNKKNKISSNEKRLLPKRVLAVTESFPDKYIYSKNKDEFYYYLGLQNTTNAAFIKKSGVALIQTLMDIYSDDFRIGAFESILKSIGYDPTLYVFLNEKKYIFDKEFVANLEPDLIKYLKLAFKQMRANDQDDLILWQWLSSGEKHILNSFCRIIRYIDDNSLILIDEPEISLHPAWQIRYIPLLREVFNNYKNCQFIIASHSHFIATGLPKHESSLLSLSKKNFNEHITQLFGDNYSGMSAEKVLYEVFGVATTRNVYFQEDLKKVVSYLEKNPKERGVATDDIREAFTNLKEYLHDPRDPLNLLISEGEKVIEI